MSVYYRTLLNDVCNTYLVVSTDGGSTGYYRYTDCNGVLHTGVPVVQSTHQTICAMFPPVDDGGPGDPLINQYELGPCEGLVCKKFIVINGSNTGDNISLQGLNCGNDLIVTWTLSNPNETIVICLVGNPFKVFISGGGSITYLGDCEPSCYEFTITNGGDFGNYIFGNYIDCNGVITNFATSTPDDTFTICSSSAEINDINVTSFSGMYNISFNGTC